MVAGILLGGQHTHQKYTKYEEDNNGFMRFKYYLHDSADSGERRSEMERQGVRLSEEAWANLGRPFYEITLECDVDKKGKVKILRVLK